MGHESRTRFARQFSAYLSRQAQNLTRVAGIAFRLEMPESLPVLTLSSIARHHLFLATNEALHNVVKHATAQTVQLRLALEDGVF